MTASEKSYWQILTVLWAIQPKTISLAVSLAEGFVQGAQRKKLVIALFVKRF